MKEKYNRTWWGLQGSGDRVGRYEYLTWEYFLGAFVFSGGFIVVPHKFYDTEFLD